MSGNAISKGKFSATLEWCKAMWSAVPVLGHLVHCNRKDHTETLREFSVTVIFGTATFWVTALFLLPFSPDSEYLALVRSTMADGQLFIFSVGMLGPILFVALDEPVNAKKFPGKTSHVVFLALVAIVAAGLYAIQLVAKNQNLGSALPVDTGLLFRVSLVIAILVLIVRYLTTVYRKNTLSFDPETQMKDPVSAFADQFANRHRVNK